MRNQISKTFIVGVIILNSTQSLAQSLLINVRELMEPTQNIKIETLISRFYALQKPSIDQGKISEYFAKCIAASSVHILKQNAARFLEITEHEKKGIPLSQLEKNQLEVLANNNAYLLNIAAQSCSYYDQHIELRDFKSDTVAPAKIPVQQQTEKTQIPTFTLITPKSKPPQSNTDSKNKEKL